MINKLETKLVKYVIIPEVQIKGGKKTHITNVLSEEYGDLYILYNSSTHFVQKYLTLIFLSSIFEYL